jgi:flagellar basal-body rod protein FlgC
MDLFAIFDINSAGMSVEQSKLAIAASNIANARTTKTADGGVYRPLSVTVAASSVQNAFNTFETAGLDATRLPRPMVTGYVETNAAPRLVYDPGHPDADDKGFVSLPGVDPVTSMLDLMTISRSYEANLRAFDITRNLIQKTLEMGKGR